MKNDNSDGGGPVLLVHVILITKSVIAYSSKTLKKKNFSSKNILAKKINKTIMKVIHMTYV